MKIRLLTLAVLLFALLETASLHAQSKLNNRGDSSASVLTGANAFTSYSSEKPGTRRKLTVADLPQPYATESADNHPRLIPRPSNAWPQALPGFKVELYASGLQNPRLLRVAPNGDLFVAESAAGEMRVLRGINKNGKAEQESVFTTGLQRPFGIAFYPPGRDPQWIYVGNTDSVLRFPYSNGDLKARGAAQVIVPSLPSGARVGGGGHWTRDVLFSKDGSKMYVSVGSRSNVDDPDNHPAERNRADILEFNPDGSGLRVYASGLRNPVGITLHPETGALWASVQERDELGDNLVPDYITHVQNGGFYGWPWYYLGGHQDPRLQNKHPELKDKVITPDVILQPHFATMDLLFYEGQQFPPEYRGDIFAPQHGSWNRSQRAGYEVIRVPVKNGRATGGYEDFLTGFVTAGGQVWGRPVGIAVAKDGSLLVSDDGSDSIWRVSYQGQVPVH